jgi:hypothetical protein
MNSVLAGVACDGCSLLLLLLLLLLLFILGAAPFFMSERATEKLRSRKTKPQTYNLDMNLIGELLAELQPSVLQHEMHCSCPILYPTWT